MKKALPPSHPSLATMYYNIGVSYSDLHNYENALECFKKALSIFKISLPDNHPYIQQTLENIKNL